MKFTKKKISKNLLLSIIILTSFSNIFGASQIKLKAREMIVEILRKDVNLIFKKIDIKPSLKRNIEKRFRQRFFKSWLYYWEIKEMNRTIAYALLDNVYGKSLPITFITVFNLNGSILGCRIIKYREPHGNEVKDKKWLGEFIGKSGDSLFKMGKDIDGISGATISSASLIKGNGKLAVLIGYLIGTNQ